MKYLSLIFLLSFFLVSNLDAQNDDFLETIQYEDGSYFIGRTIEENSFQILFELESTKDTIRLNPSMIDKWFNTKDFFTFKGGRYHKKNGKFNLIEYSVGGNEIDATVQFEYITGKLLKPRLGVGLGLGINFSTINNITWTPVTFAEIFAYGKYYLNDNRRRLFVDSKLGAAIALESDDWMSYTSGPLLQVGFGVELARSKRLRWSFKISQLMQYTTIRINDANTNFFDNSFVARDIQILDKRLFNRTMIGIGLHF